MHPESNTPSNRPPIDREAMIKKWLTIGAPVLFVVLVLATIFWPRPHFQHYELEETGFNVTEDYSYVDKSDLFAYDGMSFYKTNLNNGKTTILNSGNRLPVPSEVYWANSQGALLNFSSSVYLSKAEQALRASGESVAYEAQDYTWYLDFSSDTLHLVSKLPVIPNLAYYSETDNGFYYMNDLTETPDDVTPLYFYDLATHKNEVISKELGVTDISGLQDCPAAERLCFLGRDQVDPVKERLYGITKDNHKKVIYETSGRLYATNKPGYYLEAKYEDEDSNQLLEGGAPEGTAYLRNISNNTSRKLDFTIGASEPSFHFVNDSQFYVLDSQLSSSANEYWVGNLTEDGAQTATSTLVYNDDFEFDGQLSGTVSHGSGGKALVATPEGNQLMFSSNADNLPTLSAPNIDAVQKAIDTCIASSPAQDKQYFEDTRTFRLFFVSDDAFLDKIKQFGNCIKQSDTYPFYGYRLELAGIDPVNGRISTD